MDFSGRGGGGGGVSIYLFLNCIYVSVKTGLSISTVRRVGCDLDLMSLGSQCLYLTGYFKLDGKNSMGE